MNNISDHISFAESIKSVEAIRLGMDNIPGEKEIASMKLLAEKVFEPLRSYITLKRGKDSPIHINSFFRSKEVNENIRGSKSSQHVLGEAIDIECSYPDFNNKDLFLTIKDKCAFDQLIWEFSDPNNQDIPAWVHVSYKKEGNRKQVLKAIKEDGQTKYIPFT